MAHISPSIQYLLHRHLQAIAREDPPPAPAKSLEEILRTNPNFQAELDTLIEQRLARDRRARGTRGGGGDDDNSQLDPKILKELSDLRTYRTERERKDEEAKGNYERALKSQQESFESEKSEWQKERDAYLSDIKHDRCWGQLIAAASKSGAFDPDDIATLLLNRVGIDDKRRTVVFMEDGKTPAMVKGRPMTVDELIESHKAARPRLYKAPEGVDDEGADGAGSGGGDGEGKDRKSKHMPGSSGDAQARLEAAEAELEEARKEAARQPGSVAALAKAKDLRRKVEAIKKEIAEGKRKAS